MEDVKKKLGFRTGGEACEWLLNESMKLVDGIPGLTIVTRNEFESIRGELQLVRNRLHEIEMGKYVVPEFYIHELEGLSDENLQKLGVRFGIFDGNRNEIIWKLMQSDNVIVTVPDSERYFSLNYKEMGGKNCTNCHEGNHKADKCPKPCRNCGESDHWSKVCPYPKSCEKCGGFHQGEECKLSEEE